MKFRKKPVVIEAVRYQGANGVSISEIIKFCDSKCVSTERGLEIQTLEGSMLAIPGDWIIKGVAGEFYPCRDDIFQKTYEKVD